MKEQDREGFLKSSSHTGRKYILFFKVFSLRRGRFRGDMLKMINGIDKVNLEKLFCIDEKDKEKSFVLKVLCL